MKKANIDVNMNLRAVERENHKSSTKVFHNTVDDQKENAATIA